MADWGWVLEGDLATSGSLMFIRGGSPTAVVEAHGMSADKALILPRARAAEALRHPVTVRQHVIGYPWLRAGVTGEWAFAIEETWLGEDGSAAELIRRLSAETEMAWISWTGEQGSWNYIVNGSTITWFDPAEPWRRFGRKPDQFVDQMREAGLPVDEPKRKQAAPAGDSRIAALETLTLALGIRLGREAALGPLLTVQTDTETPPGSPCFDDDDVVRSEWDWFSDPDYPMNALFARGVTPDRIVEALGVAPSDARRLTQRAARKDPGVPWVRVGQAGEWAFAFDNGCAGPAEFQRIALDLSAGTEAVAFDTGYPSGYFRYYTDGTLVTSFEPRHPWDRTGTDPDRFLPVIPQVGLRRDDDDEDYRDPAISLLEMLSLTLGIRLSRKEATGPLLTMRPDLNGPGLRQPEPEELRW